MSLAFADLKHQPAAAVRAEIRSGAYAGHTAGLGQMCLQANLAILPEAVALDFMRFCQRNPKSCPLVGVSETGAPSLPTLGAGIDVRTDLPGYVIYRDGAVVETVEQITALWQQDFVTFALGCSFTFEQALQAAGIALWHIDNNTTVPMYATALRNVPAGPFAGEMVVSMRAIPADRVEDVARICRRYPLAHGAPVHWGDPAAIGIRDIAAPEWGDPAPIPAGHVPVFWACGVTPQLAIMQARLPLAIAHKPGHMLITDVPHDAENPVLTP